MEYEVSYVKNPELLQPGQIVFEDPAGLPKDVPDLKTTVLTSGKTIRWPGNLSGGGQIQKKYFLQAIGDKKYTNAFEWCAGHGEIGFELITNGICQTLTFSDCYDRSTEWCLRNAESLDLKDQVFAYTTPKIANIPANHKWDLIVGNPPNCNNVDYTYLEQHRKHQLSEDHYRLYLRTTIDIGFVAHYEFFQNIKQFLTDDADIFISYQISQLSLLNEPFAKYGFKLVEIFDMLPDDPGLKVFYIKSV